MVGGRKWDVCSQDVDQETFLRAELVTDAEKDDAPTRDQIVRPKRDECSKGEEIRGCIKEDEEKRKSEKQEDKIQKNEKDEDETRKSEKQEDKIQKSWSEDKEASKHGKFDDVEMDKQRMKKRRTWSEKNKEKTAKKVRERSEEEEFWSGIEKEFEGKDKEEEMSVVDEFMCKPCDASDLSPGGATEEGEEGRRSKGLMSPMKVTKEEREDHERTHTPFRSWCRFCVKGRAYNCPHQKNKDSEEEKEANVPRVSMDYFYMSQKDEEAMENPVLVVLNESTNEKYARAAGQKGVGNEGAVQWLVKDVSEELKTWGHQGGEGGKIILKCDGEKAMTALRDAVAKFHGGEVIPEGPAKGESQSNGRVEEAGKTVRGFVRVFKEQLEEKAEVKLEPEDDILQWMIRWAAMVPSRFLVGKDGKTGHERRRGRKCKIHCIPFAEKVWYKRIRERKQQENKMDSEWFEGLWLGHHRNTNEILIGTTEGVVRAYAIRRKAEDQRWDPVMIKEMKGTPQQPDPSKPGGQIPVRIRFDEAAKLVPEETKPARVETELRRFRITTPMLERYGFTEGCQGCRFKQAGLKDGRGHSETCRTRLMEAMKEDEEGRKVLDRETHRIVLASGIPDEGEDERMEADADNIEMEGETMKSEGINNDNEDMFDRTDDEEADGNKDEDMETKDTRSLNKLNLESKLIKEVKEATYEEIQSKIKELEFETKLIKEIRNLQVDVTEVYSPPRVTTTATKRGLTAGEAMDLSTGWDFTMQKHRDAAMKYVKTVRPKLVIGSPECRLFSALQNLSKHKQKSEEQRQELVEAKEHIKFVVELYKEQVKNGRWFLHEHPAQATSWDMEEIKQMAAETGVKITTADQCMYGLRTWGANRQIKDKHARKRTKFMTNSEHLANELNKRCKGEHAHQELVDGRAKEAAKYPEPLCQAICTGLIKELCGSGQQLRHLMTVEHSDVVQEEEQERIDGKKKRGIVHLEDEPEMKQAWDDQTGQELPLKEVRKARLTEIGYIEGKKVWRKISRREAVRRGIKIVAVRWIDINKGDLKNPIYRSRLVAKEFNDGKDMSIFAGTPPLEALRLLVSEAATSDGKEQWENKIIMINDVARAFFEAPAIREICVEIPNEARSEEDDREDNVAILEKSLYGTRDAAQNFQREVRRTMMALGFKNGGYNACTYYHEKRKLKTMVHGDDFVTVGMSEDAEWLENRLKERFEIKTHKIGGKENMSHEGKVLNRIIRRTQHGWEYEADQRHAELIVKTLKLEDAKAVSTPGEDEKEWLMEEESEKLGEIQAREYRALAARANYMGADRADVQYAVKEICRGMANPTKGDWRKLKRLGRYLVGKPRVVLQYKSQGRQSIAWGFSDSDWAGCKRTAKSTSGGALMIGDHLIKSWSSTQKNITLSSGEAELVAAVKACTELIGLTQLAQDWGVELKGKVYVDSSAAIGVAHRKGNGRLRHVKVGLLWIQEKVEEGEVEVKKVGGEENPADLMTKNVNAAKVEKFMRMMRQEVREGRAEAGLELK